MNQIMPLLSLYSEIIACLFAASVLSLFIGWMLHKSKAERKLNTTTREWKKRYSELEEMTHKDAENLEKQLQSMASDMKALQAYNRMLNDSMKANDGSAQKSRAEAIELNRQHAETQERLQRIIQQKEREVLELGNRVNQLTPSAGKGTASSRRPFSVFADDTDTLGEGDMAHARTIVINTSEMFDATMQMSAHELLAPRGEFHYDDELESTVVIGTETIDMEESTVVLDEDVLAYARRSSKPDRND